MAYTTRFGKVVSTKKSKSSKVTSDKGEFMGICNRFGCATSPANYYHRTSMRHYCESCAYAINAESKELDTPLCILVGELVAY